MQSRPDKLARLLAILSDVTGAPAQGLGLHSTPENTPGWDSLANLALMTGIEEELGVTISTADVIRLRSLEDLLAHVSGARASHDVAARD